MIAYPYLNYVTDDCIKYELVEFIVKVKGNSVKMLQEREQTKGHDTCHKEATHWQAQWLQ